MIRYNTTLQIPGQPFQSIISTPAVDGYWVKASDAGLLEVRIADLERRLNEARQWEYRYNGVKEQLEQIKTIVHRDD